MARSRRRKAGHDDHEEHFDESWLVTYADMMTLLVALFMVLFSISSVNVSKFEGLQRSLSEAFSGKVFPGGEGIREEGGGPPDVDQTIAPPLEPSQAAGDAASGTDRAAQTRKEQQDFEKLKEAIDAAVSEQGLGGKVRTEISDDGLEVRILTDDLLFESGSAIVRPKGAKLVETIGGVLKAQRDHAVLVEGHTDDIPISTARFPTNWELSTARATGVVRVLVRAGMSAKRLTAQGRAAVDPVASNGSAGGRSLNRRVEILVPRRFPPNGEAARSGTESGGADADETGEAAGDEIPSIRPEEPSIRPDATEAPVP